MVTLSDRSAGATVVRGQVVRALRANPLRRGPVVLATDATSRTGETVLAARLLASRLDVPLEVISVIEPPVPFAVAADLDVDHDPEAADVQRQVRETAVTDHVCNYSGGATPARVHVRFGNAVTEINRFARDVSATLVIVGSAPHQRLGHRVSGDRAAHLLRSAPCPILSVAPTFRGLPQKVVAAVDFGPSSVRAAQAALLVIDAGGTLVLTYVLPPIIHAPALSSPPQDAGVDAPALFERLRAELAPSVPMGVTLETRVISDDAVTGIVTSAAHVDAEVIAVGTHGPRLLARLLLGSVAERVIHTAEQTVIAAPPPTAAEALELWRRITGVATSTREHDWSATLNEFTRRNVGHPVLLEVDDPETGARVTGHGYSLVGVTYEPGAHRVEIMVGDARQPLRHLSRSVMHPDAITMSATGTDGAEVLDIRHGRGHTIAVVAGEAGR